MMRSLKTKLMAVLIAVSLAALFAITIFLYSGFKTCMIDELSKARNVSLKEIAQSADDLLNRLRFIAGMTAEDKNMMSSFISTNLNSISEYSLNSYLSSLYLKNRSYIDMEDYPVCVVVLCENGYTYCSAYNDRIIENLKQAEWLSENVENGQDSYLTAIENPAESETGNVIAAVENIRRGSFRGYSASVIVYIDARALEEIYSFMLEEDNEIYVIDNTLTAVSTSNQGQMYQPLFSEQKYASVFEKADYSVAFDEGKEWLYSRQKLKDSGWAVIEKLSMETLMQPFGAVVGRTAGFVILFTFLCVLISVFMSSFITKPLARFCSNINKAEKNQILEPVQIMKDYIEIEELSNSYNRLILRIHSLMDEITTKERKIHQSEIAFLRAQISPHFLYNTLFSIKCTVDLGRNKDASQMISLLLSTLHLALEQKERDTTIANECLYIQKYIELQQLRYGDKLHMVIDIADEFNNCRILRHLIQPIVENSIFHGIEPLGAPGIIKLTCKNLGNDLLIDIWDNGVGIQNIEEIGRAEANQSQSHIGLANIHKRIQLNYGENFGLEVPACKSGTCIRLHLPKIT